VRWVKEIEEAWEQMSQKPEEIDKKLEKEWNEFVGIHQEASLKALESIKMERVGESEDGDKEVIEKEINEY